MVMAEQIGTPRVQDGEEPNLGAEPFGVGGHLEQGLGTGLEQQVEERSGCGESQRVQIVGNGEDDVEIVGVEQIALLRFEPSPASLRLAFWTAPRSAGVVGEGCFVLAVDTLVFMSAQSRGATTRHSSVCLQLLIAEIGRASCRERA